MSEDRLSQRPCSPAACTRLWVISAQLMPSDWLLNPVYFIGGRSAFGWIKCVNGLRQAKLSCLAITDWAFTFAPAAYRSGAAAEADRNGAMTAPVVNRELI